MDRIPKLTETQWRTVFDTLEAATPIGATFESDKEELAWYRRSEVIQSIKSCFGWRTRSKHKAEVGVPMDAPLLPNEKMFDIPSELR